MVLHLNKLESTSPKYALGQDLVEISPVVVEKKILNFVNVFSLFRNYFPLEKGGALHLNKLESSSPRVALCQFGWNWSSGSGEEAKMWKIYDKDNKEDNDNWQIVIRKAHLSLRLRWTKKGYLHVIQVYFTYNILLYTTYLTSIHWHVDCNTLYIYIFTHLLTTYLTSIHWHGDCNILYTVLHLYGSLYSLPDFHPLTWGL